MGKIPSFELSPGFSFGRDGRFAVLRPLGRGWEGEVYVVADTDAEEPPFVKAVKFSRLRDKDDWSSATTWCSDEIHQRGYPVRADGCRDTTWLVPEAMNEEERNRAKKRLNEVRQKIECMKALGDFPHLKIISRVEDYGLVILPVRGNLLPVVFEVMEFEDGEPLADFLDRQTDPKVVRRMAEAILESLLEAVAACSECGLCLGPDINVENVLVCGTDRKTFRLVDADITKAGVNDPQLRVQDTVKKVLVLALQAAHWGDLGAVVKSHVQGHVYLKWLDDPVALDKLEPRLSSGAKANAKRLVFDMDRRAWPEGLWTDC